MATKLKATKPVPQEKRLKMFVFGPAGVGKTMAAINFPNAYIIDTEKGTDFYANTINKAESVVFQSANPDEIKEQIKGLLTEQHPYKTLIIDPVTQLYNSTQEKWNRIFEKYARGDKERETQDWGVRFWGKVKSDFKSIQRLLLALDMNVIVTSHQKDIYSNNMVKSGVTFDSMKGDDYFFDLIFRVDRINSDVVAFKVKERAEIGLSKFPDQFVWSYKNFCDFYGKEIIEKAAAPISMANSKQVEHVNSLLKIVKLEDSIIEKWFMKAGVEEWAEMKSDTIQKCIDYLESIRMGTAELTNNS